MDTYVFKKPGFSKRQSANLKTPGQRKSILVDCDLNRDPKMLALYAEKDVALIGILFEIWANLDTKTETWEVQKQHFDHWVKKTFAGSNRFDVLKRIQWLSENGLIDFQLVSNESLTPFQCTSNDLLTHLYCDPNTLLEQPETPVAVISNIKQAKQAKQADTGACEFSKNGLDYALRSGNPNISNLSWVEGYLDTQYTEIRDSKPGIPAEALLKIWQECCDDASSKGISAPKWYKTTFENRASRWAPHQKTRPQGSQIPANSIKLAHERVERSGKL